MVSAISDYGGMIDASKWTKPILTEYQQILERLDNLDKKLGEPECHDPSKLAWMKAIEERLAKLEQMNGVDFK